MTTEDDKLRRFYPHLQAFQGDPYGPRGVFWFFFFLILALLLIRFDLGPDKDQLGALRQRGELVILTRNAPTTYYELDDRPQGFEYELARAFALSLNLHPRFVIKETEEAIYTALARGEGDMAAAGISAHPGREKEARFGPVYGEVSQQVVCRRGGKRPENILELPGVKLTVVHGSIAEQRLKELKSFVPNLKWVADRENSAEQLLEQVWQKELECTVAESNIVALSRRYLPDLAVRFTIGKPSPLTWVLPRSAVFLQRELERWFQRMRGANQIAHLHERYFGYVEFNDFDYVDSWKFHRRVESRLPKYRAVFQRAAERHGVPWTLVAAQAYQESHWNPDATSFTGVRGLMMLTNETARNRNVKNRLDPEESVMGGVSYLAELRDRLPPEVAEPDRTWLALAAYNLGMGHLLDARELAVRLGKNPDAWNEMRGVLPLLSREEYFRTLKRGYARGSEAVHFVQRVRHYLDILTQREAGLVPRIVEAGVGDDDDAVPPPEERAENATAAIPVMAAAPPTPPLARVKSKGEARVEPAPDGEGVFHADATPWLPGMDPRLGSTPVVASTPSNTLAEASAWQGEFPNLRGLERELLTSSHKGGDLNGVPQPLPPRPAP